MPAPAGNRRGALIRFAVLLAVLGVAFLLARQLGLLQSPTQLADRIRRLRDIPGLPALFVVAYIVATALAIPGTALTLAGGALFGFGWGSLLNWLGATGGAVVAYGLARALGQDAVRSVLGRRADRFGRLTEEHGLATMFRLRLLPLVPFNALNFGAGFAGVRVRDYILATALGIIPGTVVYSYFADALLSGASSARHDAFVRLLIASALLMTLSFLPAIARRLGLIAAGSVLLAAPPPAAALQTPSALSQTFDHRRFDVLLKSHVAQGMVDYGAFERAPDFATYLAALAAADPAAHPKSERLALWINAYNAYTIHLINKHHERNSIRNVNKSLGFLKLKGPWGEPLAVVGGHAYTLDQIEHDVIRKEFQEPRIHFALVCAAMGCPPLRNEAYTGAALDGQLEDQGRAFLRESPGKNRVDVASGTVYLSMIFNYYKKDFGGTDPSVAHFIAHWYSPGPERDLLESGRAKHEETSYDWTLNSQDKARRRT
ncbi:MAG: hypothetical protein NVS9B3_10630 [Gemmatimonadaceae bacterium]